MSVRVARFEISRVVAENGRERMDEWRELSESCQQITNFFWQQWLIAHVQAGTPAKIREFLSLPKESRGKFGVFALGSEMRKEIEARVRAEFSTVNSRTITLILDQLAKKVDARKAANSNLSGWWAILLSRESLPSSTRGVPVPFDSQNASLIAPCGDCRDWFLDVRVNRIEVPGRSRAISTLDKCLLWTKGRRMAGQVAILRRIASGEYKFCGSSLMFDQQKRKWFAMVCYQRPERKAAEGSVTAVLTPGRRFPWRLRIGGRTLFPMGDGRYIPAIRRKLLTQRWNRQANYRYAGSSNKGHGRNRAMLPIEKLSRKWKQFVDTNNHQLSIRVVRICQQYGVARIIYRQPVDSARNRMFLTSAGKIPGREDSTGWDWAQAGSKLAYKAKDEGIHAVVLRTGEKLGGEKVKKKRGRKK